MAAASWPHDTLRVFISSTIGECAAEREQARSAVISLNLVPFTFEHGGARPFPPRSVYLSKLYDSHIFVAIYKKSYGWIAPGATRSGIEDELIEAQRIGMPCLVYVHTDCDGRDERLTQLLTTVEAQAQVTYGKFSTPLELYGRIRDDVTAIVSQRFFAAGTLYSLVGTDDQANMSALLPAEALYVSRLAVQQKLEEAATRAKVLNVTGPAGIGKTTLLAALANARSFVFITASNLTLLDLANAITNRLSGKWGSDAIVHVNPSNAFGALAEVWKTSSVTVVLDDVDNSSIIRDLLRIIEPAPHRKVIYTLRGGAHDPAHEHFEVPAFNLPEILEFMGRAGKTLDPGQALQIQTSTQGNPLALRYVRETEDITAARSIQAFEAERFGALSSHEREIVSYVAVSPAVLTIEDLLDLVGGEPKDAEVFANYIEHASWFVQQSSAGIRLRHDHQRDTITKLLQSRPQLLFFYARRVAALLRKRGDYVGAFVVLALANDSTRVRWGRQAAFDASRRGDFLNLSTIINDLLAAQGDEAAADDTVLLLLALSEACHHLGDHGGSIDALDRAEKIANAHGTNDAVLRVREQKAWHAAATGLEPESIEQLEQLESEYEQAGDSFSEARMALELSVVRIRTGDFVEAENQARRALAGFEAAEDSYGMSLARRNLASALSNVPGKSAELSRVLGELQRIGVAQDDRERAWLCNHLTRQFRRAREYAKAERYGAEAISIAERLGDRYLVALNRINLGNVFRDQGRLDDALSEYQAAAAEANRTGSRDLEATGCRLASTVLRAKNECRAAIQHATVAVALLRGTAAASDLAASLEELGDAHDSVGSTEEAVAAYKQAGITLLAVKDSDGWRLVHDALALATDKNRRDLYVKTVEAVTGVSGSGDLPTGPVGLAERLYGHLSALLAQLDEEHMIGILGLHFRMLFEGLPLPIARFLYESSVKAILARVDAPLWHILFPLVPLLTAVPRQCLRIEDCADLAYSVAARTGELHCKPHEDRSPHWVFTLGFSTPVICSVTALDDEVETALVCAVLTFFLKSFDARIQEEIIGSVPISRNEVRVAVGSSKCLPEDLKREIDPHLVDSPVAVSRPTDLAAEDTIPTWVTFRHGIADEWRPGSGRAVAVHHVIARTLAELLFQLFKGEIPPDVLTPKLLNIVRLTLS